MDGDVDAEEEEEMYSLFGVGFMFLFSLFFTLGVLGVGVSACVYCWVLVCFSSIWISSWTVCSCV